MASCYVPTACLVVGLDGVIRNITTTLYSESDKTYNPRVFYIRIIIGRLSLVIMILQSKHTSPQIAITSKNIYVLMWENEVHTIVTRNILTLVSNPLYLLNIHCCITKRYTADVMSIIHTCDPIDNGSRILVSRLLVPSPKRAEWNSHFDECFT